MVQTQQDIMMLVNEWGKSNNTPIPLSFIALNKPDVNIKQIRATVDTLCKKGYLRKSCMRGKSTYVRLRNGF
jgi:hypothetical protein